MLLEVIVISLLIGWISGGKISRLAEVKLVGAELIIGAFIVQLIVPKVTLFNPSLGHFFHAASYIMLLIAFLHNRLNASILLMAGGIFLNFIVIGLNGGMPVKAASTVAFNDSIHLQLTASTYLPWLGDVIVWPFPGALGGMVSIGDILLSAGVAGIIIGGMRYKGKRAYLHPSL